ncbi:site-specific integrase [Nonomuraea sp. NPDC001684]
MPGSRLRRSSCGPGRSPAARLATNHALRGRGDQHARTFLEHLRTIDEPLYAAFVLMLVLGLRRGEVLGLTWDSINLDGQELWVSQQLNRVHGKLLHRNTTKTTDSDASLPLPALCVTALKHRRRVQEGARKEACDKWKDSVLVFTTRYGTRVEPRNFNRSFELRGNAAGVPRIRVHDTRHTCASMLATLGVHPRVAMRILRHSQISVAIAVLGVGYLQVASPTSGDDSSILELEGHAHALAGQVIELLDQAPQPLTDVPHEGNFIGSGDHIHATAQLLHHVALPRPLGVDPEFPISGHT